MNKGGTSISWKHFCFKQSKLFIIFQPRCILVGHSERVTLFIESLHFPVLILLHWTRRQTSEEPFCGTVQQGNGFSWYAMENYFCWPSDPLNFVFQRKNRDLLHFEAKRSSACPWNYVIFLKNWHPLFYFFPK